MLILWFAGFCCLVWFGLLFYWFDCFDLVCLLVVGFVFGCVWLVGLGLFGVGFGLLIAGLCCDWCLMIVLWLCVGVLYVWFWVVWLTRLILGVWRLFLFLGVWYFG